MVGDRTHTVNFALQGNRIRTLFPASDLVVSPFKLVWRHSITPSSLSATYDVELVYVRDDHPKVYIVNSKLALYPGELTLPHVYDSERQWLCLYRKGGGEWKSNMFLADTVIPWISEWLLHYECWLCTGEWWGGGVHYRLKKKEETD